MRRCDEMTEIRWRERKIKKVLRRIDGENYTDFTV